MEFVQPIRDRKKIETMKKILKSQNIRDHCLFVLGINSGLRVSDLLKLTIADVLDERGKVKDRITLREKKTGKVKNFPLSDNVHGQVAIFFSYMAAKTSIACKVTFLSPLMVVHRMPCFSFKSAKTRSMWLFFLIHPNR